MSRFESLPWVTYSNPAELHYTPTIWTTMSHYSPENTKWLYKNGNTSITSTRCKRLLTMCHGTLENLAWYPLVIEQMLAIGSARPALREDLTKEINWEMIMQFWNRRRIQWKGVFFWYLLILSFKYKMIFFFFFWQEFRDWRFWYFLDDQNKNIHLPSSQIPLQLISLDYPRWRHRKWSLTFLPTSNMILKIQKPWIIPLHSKYLNVVGCFLGWGGTKSRSWFLLL